MSAADCLGQAPVDRPKPLLVVVPSLEVEVLKEGLPDPLASIRRHLEESNGVLTLSCGCYLRVHVDAMKTLSTQAIVAALCESAGTCCHQTLLH
jgi:hypothetical protein